ncbi:hypothetical protein WDU94_013163 [Cyamophila willieti]
MTTLARKLEFRPLDFIYDPCHIVSDAADYYTQASTALKHVSQYGIQPQYGTMFSDNDKYHRNLVVLRSTILPHHVNVSWTHKKRMMTQDRRPHPHQATLGSEACKYFTRPNVNKLDLFANINRTSPVQEEDEVDSPTDQKLLNMERRRSSKTPKKVRKAVQTMYRESEAQTYPWAPKLEGSSLDMVGVTLDFEKWEKGFPVTKKELHMIERTTIRRVCENAVNSMSVLKDKNNLIKQIEIYEWWQREEDIAVIYKLREKLSKKQTYVFTCLNQQRMQKRLDTLIAIKKQEMDKKLDQINKKKERDLRKLAARQNKKPMDVIDTYNNYTSELYMKNRTQGINSKYQNRLKMNITARQLQKDTRFVDSVDELLKRSDLETRAKPKTPSECPQKKKWNAESLIELFKTVGKPVLPCSSWEDRNDRLKVTKKTDTREFIQEPNDDFNPEDDERYLDAVLIEKVLRGRKWQAEVQEGMAKTKNIIDEIKQANALTGEDIEVLEGEKQVVFDKLREEDMKEKRMDFLDSVQGQLQGETISAVLDFLSKELIRLQDERNAHAYSLLAERQRELREAIESGKRQKEIERRKEFDEMFKQMVKIKQDSVDNYLESVLLDSVHCTSEDQAKRFIQEKAKVIDQQAQEAFLRRDKIEDEAIIADLLYNVAIPEVENIRVHTCEKQAQERATKDTNNLIPSMDVDSLHEDMEDDEDRRKMIQELHEQLLDMMFPRRRKKTKVPSEKTGEGSVQSVGESEEEIDDELSEELKSAPDDIGLELYDELLAIVKQTYEQGLNHILQEIIKKLLAKPLEDLDKSSSESNTSSICRVASSFSEQGIDEDDYCDISVKESVSKISHRLSEDYEQN